MAVDLKRTHYSLRLGRELAAGTVVDAEGLLMVAVLEDGKEKAGIQAAVAGTEELLGFSQTADSLPERTSAVERVTVPATGDLEVDLRNNNLVSARLRAVVVSSGQVLTIDETFAGATADDNVKVDLAAGRAKFHADEAGEEVILTYLYDLTRVQAKQIFGERHINNQGLHAEFGQIEIGTGIGEIYTDKFDASQDYSADPVLTLINNGYVGVGGAGPAIPAKVVSVPSEDNPFLGLRFNFTAP